MANSADRRRVQLFSALGTVLERIPVGIAVSLAEAGGAVASLRSSGPRAAVEANIKRIVELDATESVDPRVLKRLVRRSFASYGRYWAEGAVLPVMDHNKVVEKIHFVGGEEHLHAAMASGKGCIVALPHIGSWEWGGAFMAAVDYPMTAVAERLEPPELFEWFAMKREQMGLRIVGLDDTAGRKLLSVLNNGGLVGLLCDRDIEGDGIEVTLLGERTSIPAGPATLALRSGAVLLVGTIYSGPGQHHSVLLTEPLDTARTPARLREDVARVSQDIADRLSDLIRRAPEQWHVFSDPFTLHEERSRRSNEPMSEVRQATAAAPGRRGGGE